MDEQEQQIVPPSQNESDIAWNNVIANIRKQKREKKRRKIFLFSSITAAAIIIISSSVIAYKSSKSPDIYFANDKNITITLADHSEVTLLKGARLTVEKSFPANTRDVILEGNALFKVSKSKTHPFIVHANGYETKVLGTVFKVIQSNSVFKVDLYEGRVQVNQKGKKEQYVIHPRETFSNMGLSNVATVAPTDPKKISTPVSKATITFNEVPLEDAITVLEQTYGIKIKFPAQIENSTISATDQQAAASDFIRIIALKLNLNIKKVNDKIFELEE